MLRSGDLGVYGNKRPVVHFTNFILFNLKFSCCVINKDGVVCGVTNCQRLVNFITAQFLCLPERNQEEL